MSTKKPLAPTSRPTKKAEATTPPPAPAATASKATLHPVFVYGSLKKGHWLHDSYLGDQMFVGNAVITGYTMLSLGKYPAILQTNNPNHQVLGEYYLVSDEVFNSLKKMEEDVGYETKTVKGRFSTSAAIPSLNDAPFSANAWVYYTCQDGLRNWTTVDAGKRQLLMVETIDTKQQENKA